jgi:hypothetical protein
LLSNLSVVIEVSKRGVRDALEQRAVGIRTGEDANAEQDAEQQARGIACLD